VAGASERVLEQAGRHEGRRATDDPGPWTDPARDADDREKGEHSGKKSR
jgi:hypothetical protein